MGERHGFGASHHRIEAGVARRRRSPSTSATTGPERREVVAEERVEVDVEERSVEIEEDCAEHVGHAFHLDVRDAAES